MMALPITSVKPSQYDGEPYNNLKNNEIMLLGESYCDAGTTIVFDSHYMDLEGTIIPIFLADPLVLPMYFPSRFHNVAKKKLTERGREFIAKCNPGWWKELVEKAATELGKKDGDFVVMWSDETQEHFMMYNSMSKKGKIKRKCVLTNAFTNVNKKNSTRM
jgi:hypothetical protein